MEDVVLHYQPGSAAGLNSVLETTEKLLEPFPRRTRPVFSPWFPTAADLHLPIRPARPAPIITCCDLLPSDSRPRSTQSKQKAETHHERATEAQPEDPRILDDGVCVSETPQHLHPLSPSNKPERHTSILSPKKLQDGVPASVSPRTRSWSVFTQRGALLQSSLSMSRHFHHMVSKHRLHLRQRAKWVISQDNCGGARDIEQVWRSLSRCVQSSSRLLSCNANIQREQAEIWVFCDVLQAEQVGRFLKDELQLSGRIVLAVQTLGNIYSM